MGIGGASRQKPLSVHRSLARRRFAPRALAGAAARALWHDRPMRAVLSRLFVMLPDAITSGLFLVAWVAPRTLGPKYVSDLMLMMLIEFIVMHSSGIYAFLSNEEDIPRAQRLRLLGMVSAVYVLFVLVFSLAFESFWPLFAFAWLLASRFAHLLLRRESSDLEIQRMIFLWIGSGLTYVIGGTATAKLPLPALGVTPEFVASMHLNGSGVWFDRPYTVLAFGAVYFAAQALIKYGVAGIGKDGAEHA
jgi:hypothetical protein